MVNSLAKSTISVKSKFKASADDELNFNQIFIFIFERTEKIVGKAEYAVNIDKFHH